VGPNQREIVAAFVNDQIGEVDEKHVAMGGEGIGQKSNVEDEPCHQRRTRNRLPAFIENLAVSRLQRRYDPRCSHRVILRTPEGR